MKMIRYAKPFVSDREIEYMKIAVEREELSGNNFFTNECRNWLETNLKIKKALIVNSCTSALELCALLANISRGDEIIMPSFTFVSTANAFVLFGGKPVFIDIREDTLNMNELLIEEAITEKTKAIVPVHYAGVACEMDAILKIAEKYNLLVIEDAAQGLGASYKGRDLGSIGSLGAMSFHQTKNITSGGEGGALFLNDQRFIDRAEIILEKGTNRTQFFEGLVDKYTWIDKGTSYLLGEISAAFLLAQLEKLEMINSDRKRIWDYYNSGFEALELQELLHRPRIPDHSTHNAHIYYLLLNTHNDRQAMLDHLNRNGIGAVFHYVPLHSSPGGKRFGKTATSMQNTDDISKRLIRLPIWAGMPDDFLDRIIQAVSDYFR